MSMWNKREESTPTPTSDPRLTPPSTPMAETKKENSPVSSMSLRTPDPDMKSGQATIGKAVKINGQIFSKEDLYIDGDIEGTVELHENKLTIGPNGRVQATVRARDVVVLGAIQGNVEASDRIEIRKEAKLVGDIKTARIVIEDGAYFKGSIDIVKSEPKTVGASAPPIVQSNASSSSPSASNPVASPAVRTASAAGVSAGNSAASAASGEAKR